MRRLESCSAGWFLMFISTSEPSSPVPVVLKRPHACRLSREIKRFRINLPSDGLSCSDLIALQPYKESGRRRIEPSAIAPRYLSTDNTPERLVDKEIRSWEDRQFGFISRRYAHDQTRGAVPARSSSMTRLSFTDMHSPYLLHLPCPSENLLRSPLHVGMWWEP